MFYDNLVAVCNQKDVSITNLTKELGISSGNISKWKSGGVPKGDTLLLFSDKLSVSVDYLLTGKEKSSKPDLSDIELELLEKFNRLLEIDKGRMLDRMETIYQSYTPEQKENVS